MSSQKTVPNSVKFLIGGTSGMAATCFVQPLDLIKNRMQLSGTKTSTITVTSSILKNEGVLALYSGLSAGLMRQATYTTTRLGIYTWLMELSSKNGQPNFIVKALLGMAAGCVGAFVGTPAEVALIRMTADGRLPIADRRNYKNVFNALFRIIREEGLFTLWRGAIPTMGRAMVVNAAQLASYSQAKQALLDTGYFEENIVLHFSSSMISGLVTTAASMPVDIAKTRIQNMKTINGKPEFTGAIDVLTKVCIYYMTIIIHDQICIIMSRKKRDHAWGENGFEDWGGYMAAKKAKLEEQFRDTANKEFKEPSKLFEGIAIFVNGYTDPTSDELRRLMMMHGGLYHHYMRPKVTTHIIASNLPYSKIIMYRKSQNPIPICKPQWIIDSIAAGKVLNFQNYLLYSNNTNVQSLLTYKLNNKKIEDNATSTMHKEQDIEQSKASAIVINNETNINNQNISKHNAINDTLKHDTISTHQSSNVKTNAQSTRDAEFLSTFYSNSRLHYIATMGTTFKDYVNELRDKSDGVFPGLDRLIKLKEARDVLTSTDCESDPEDEIYFKDKVKRKREVIIMHIDMDCFFVSVGIRNRPELRDQPVAVTHAKGNTFSANYDGKEEFGSLSEVASCSYAARKAGVKNGMFLGEALKLCPNLKTIQYDFEGYKEVSYILYDTVASYTLDIEAVSCDEMYADCTKILEASGLSPLEFATIIRKEIKQKTNCPVSTGFGNNRLQARLATRKAKPDNQFYLSNQNVETHMRTLDTRDLPGVGGTTTHKLRKMNVHTCEDLQKVSLSVLQKEFGKKMGEQLHKMCRGLDDTKLNLEHIRKSVSAEVNYGIRFRNNDDAMDFLSKLSMEVCDRLTAVRAKGRCITLKLMVRAEEAPIETAKFMGHGPCNYITKSKNLIAAVDDVNIIRKEVVSIWNQLHLTPEDMRGIGIQISRLEICKTKQNKGNLINFFSKTAKLQTCDQMSSKDDKNRCNSNFSENSKLDNSKVPLTAEPSETKNIFEAKINNLPLTKSSNVHKDESSAISCNVQTESTTTEAKDKNLHNCKAHENIIKAKNLSGISSKRATQKQTSQENFFKHTKPSSGKSLKYEIPRIQDIDMSVLIELPEDIRNEIFDEYKRNKRQQSQVAADPVNKVSDDEKNSNIQDYSQVDPDVLSALMKNDLHPDVQRDVQIYCNMKREANRVNLKESNENSSKQLQGASLSSKANNSKNKNVKYIVNNICTNEAACILQEDKILHTKDQLCEKDDVNKADSTSYHSSHIEISHNNAAMDKADTFILQNLSILHNNENIDKHQEMLITLVNHLFALPLQQVPHNYSLKQINK